MKKNIILLAAIITCCCASCFAQARKGLRINEVMVVNESNFEDDYGNKGAWIELFNSNFAPLEISSVYLTTDSTNRTMYPVPLGDKDTKIGKRQHVVFWADGKPARGTFHTSFELAADRPNWIGVYDADGRTLIDSVTVPVLAADATYARKIDGKGVGIEAWEIRDGSINAIVTPSSNNVIKDTNKKVDAFNEMDANGFGMTITAMGIVFSALLLLCLCFYVINRIGASRLQKKKMEAHGIDHTEVAREARPEGDTGEVIAAIGMALNEHLNAHDLESAILTIHRGRKTYSPWNSHIYTLRQNPRK
ncbi:MAG: lamin tail domain-containing protein [Bacteroidales bacterium]|nr:lamin tail domain-containing protein [Bacteroidales bacterium]